jgi:gliding motility-associated-like protein
VYFVWDAIPGALGYNISIDGSPFITPSSGPYGLSHTVSDLAKNTVVKAIIIALGDGPCGNSLLSDETSNTAIECEPITYTIDPYKSICEGKQITLDASTINIPNFRVSWNSGPYEASATKIYIGDKDTIFTVSVKNLNQPLCPSVDKQFEIEVTPVPAITLFSGSANDTICEGSEVEFLVLPEEYDRYVFYNGTTIVQDSDSSRFVATNLANGNDISAEVFSNECSSKSNSIKTTVIPAKNLSLAANRSGILCTNEIVQFTATQGFERYYFFDNESIVLESPNNIVDININSASITVTAIDEYNCSSVSSDTLDFSLLPLPEVEISCSVDTICLSEFASYIAEPDGLPIYQFFMNDTLLLQGNSRNIYSTDSLRSGNRVSVVGIDNNGCRSRNSVSEFPYIRPYPASEIGSEAEGICLNDSVKLFVTIDSAFPSAHYYWSTGQNSDTIKVSPLYTSKYSLYFNLGKCKNTVLDTKYITVDRETPPVANAGEDVTICIYDSIQLEASGGLNYLWNNEFTLDSAEIFNPLAKPLTTTTYLVSVRNNFCFSIDSVTVTVGLCLKDIPNPVPQIITPNNDGLNDFWEVENVDYFENNHVEIYNRWGNLVYKASPYDNTWDGKNSKGYDLPEGTFFYILDLGKEGTKLRTGFIIIKR